EAAEIADHRIDLRWGQRLRKRRHDGRKAPPVAAVVNRCPPVHVRFDSGLVASGEVRERVGLLEADCRFCCSLATRTVATGAAGVVDLLAGGELAGGAVAALGRPGGIRETRTDRYDNDRDERCLPWIITGFQAPRHAVAYGINTEFRSPR